jgi:hypothetical protein
MISKTKVIKQNKKNKLSLISKTKVIKQNKKNKLSLISKTKVIKQNKKNKLSRVCLMTFVLLISESLFDDFCLTNQ